MRKVQEHKEWLELKETQRFLVDADDVNLLGENVNIIKKNTEVLLDANKEVGPKENAKKTKGPTRSCLVTRQQDKIIT
jgi:hypothetical protein